MKKLLALLLALVMVLSFAACNQPAEEPTEEPTEPEEPVGTIDGPGTESPMPVLPAYSVGMGVVLSTGSSKTGTAQADTTVATVVLDAEGKIVAAKLDVAQTKVPVEGGVLGDLEAVDLRSKQEKKEDYGMAKVATAGEWYEQANKFCEAIIGMTGAEIEAIETAVNEGGHNVATDPDLLAACTMQITDFKAALVKACNDEYAKEFEGENWTLGLGVTTAVNESTNPTEEKDGLAAIYTNFAATVTGADGVILANLVDVAQVKVNFNAAGEITNAEDYDANFRTKKELKEDYNMVKYGGAIAEWYQQATAFENFITGMTIDEVNGIPTEINEEGNAVATDEDLLAGCTMAIADFQATLTKAIG